MTKPIIYTTISLKDNTEVQILIITGDDFSRANKSCSKQDDYDIMPFLMQNVCRVEDKKMEISYFTQLAFEDYNHIMQVIDIQITPLQKL